MKRIILLALLALLAASNGVAQGFPGERPLADDAMVMRFAEMAHTFWAERDVSTCPADQLSIYEADDLMEGADGRAILNGCTIWLLTATVTRAETHSPGSFYAVYLCRLVHHEFGHTGGLLDVRTGGLMDSTSDYYSGTPWGCRMWGRDVRQAAGSSRTRASKPKACVPSRSRRCRRRI